MRIQCWIISLVMRPMRWLLMVVVRRVPRLRLRAHPRGPIAIIRQTPEHRERKLFNHGFH